ncbi:MAG: type II toxin-antitoxin system VapC family toxin [Saprospiraceae bacterium]|nr:MAG: type II toxin-antitoxin system VapC family toxin [Saprospiraceae bacterium]
MAVKLYLLDSNAAIDYIGAILPAKAIAWLDSAVDNEVAMSVINRIEVLSFNPPDPADLVPFEELMDTVEIIPLSEDIILLTIQIRRNHKTKLPDAVVAATALTHDLTVVTRNEEDFRKIPGLKWVNPHTMV